MLRNCAVIGSDGKIDLCSKQLSHTLRKVVCLLTDSQCLHNMREIGLPILKGERQRQVLGHIQSCIGVGYFLDAFISILRHSCNPNCVVIFERSRLRIRAIRDITAGEELTLHYGGDRSDYNIRQAHLKSPGISIVLARCVHKVPSVLREH
jgi:hypothetical protein